jgi:GAF domain-containing protein
MDLPTAIFQLATVVLGELTSIDDVLQRATEVAVATIPGAFEVSVTVVNGDPRTVAASGRLSVDLDKAQYAGEAGPCLDAIHSGETVVVDDQLSESRWPVYSRRAIEVGVGSSLSVPLQITGQLRGAFNTYAVERHAFDADARNIGEKLASYAGIIVNNAALYFDASSRAQQMAEAMQSRAVIEQAKGMLMGARQCTADEAFGILVELSQNSHEKLREIAQTVVNEMSKPT